jgi:Mg/Co/Ni transporter MgtE
MQNETPPRSRHFAKLLAYRDSQALAFLQRTPDDNLVVVVQLWSDAADHQIRAVIELQSDDQTQVVFDSLTDETLAEFIERSPLGEALDQEPA